MSSYTQVQDLPQTLRDRYFHSLAEPQEWFVEELVRSGEVWTLSSEGYAVFAGDTLVEFFTTEKDSASLHLSKIFQQRPFRKGLCKSFDHILIDASKELGWSSVETGFLFRKRNPVSLEQIHNFKLVRAQLTDLSEAWEIGQDFYDSIDEIEHIFRSGGLWIGSVDGQMVGNGVMIPISETGYVVDVGMVTRRDQRNKGFASLIVAGMSDILESEGKRPVCGCAESNLASKAALEKAGFVSEHRLVQIIITD